MSDDFHTQLGALTRGQYLSRDDILLMLQIVNLDDQKKYELLVLDLREKIEREFIERGDLAWIKIEGEGLRILTHAEQSVWCEKERLRHRRALNKSYLYLVNVDTSSFSDDNKKAHERRLVTEGRYHQAQMVAEQRLKTMQTLLTPVPKRGFADPMI